MLSDIQQLTSKLKKFLHFLGLKVDSKSRTRVKEVNINSHTQKTGRLQKMQISEQGKMCSAKEEREEYKRGIFEN